MKLILLLLDIGKVSLEEFKFEPNNELYAKVLLMFIGGGFYFSSVFECVGNKATAARLILRSLLWSEDEEADYKAVLKVEENVANNEGGSEEEVHSEGSYGSNELRVTFCVKSD